MDKFQFETFISKVVVNNGLVLAGLPRKPLEVKLIKSCTIPVSVEPQLNVEKFDYQVNNHGAVREAGSGYHDGGSFSE